MTVHTDDFNTGTPGVAPSGWTARWNTGIGSPTWVVEADSTAAGGNVLKLSKSTSHTLHILTLDAAGGSVSDFEIVTRFKFSSASNKDTGIVGGRFGDGSVSTLVDGYELALSDESDDGFVINKISNGSITKLAGIYQNDVPVQNGPISNDWMYARFSCVGTDIKAKIWSEQEAEPPFWHLEASDASFTSGYVGFSSKDFDVVTRWDFFICDDTGTTISGVTGTLTALAGDIKASEAAYQVTGTLVAAANIEATEAAYNVAAAGVGNLEVTEAAYQVVTLESSGDPKVIAWTFTLDGHEFYVLGLPDETLVYDVQAQTWMVWGSGNSNVWKALYGIDWIADIGDIVSNFNNSSQVSNVLVGDNVNGALYLLQPEMAMDDDNDGLDQTQFERILYGQIPHRGRDHMPVAAVILEGSVGRLSGAVDDLTVNLQYSDDGGDSFTGTGAITTVGGTHDQWLEWRSLGSMRSPGRLFKVTDYGALTRIDGLDLYEDGT